MEKEEFLLTNLRLEDGFELKRYEKRFNKSFYEEYKLVVDALIENDLAILTKESFRLTDDGLLICDRILLKFFE